MNKRSHSLTLLLLAGITYGYLYSSVSEAPTWVGEVSGKHDGRSISSIPGEKAVLDLKKDLSPSELKIAETLNANEMEKNLAAVFLLHSKQESLSDAEFFRLKTELLKDLQKEPQLAIQSLKKAFSLVELKEMAYERSTLLQLARVLPQAERREMASLGLNYLEAEFPKSALNQADSVDASALSLPLAAFEDAFRLKQRDSFLKAKEWAKSFREGCRNGALKQALSDKEALIAEESA